MAAPIRFEPRFARAVGVAAVAVVIALALALMLGARPRLPPPSPAPTANPSILVGSSPGATAGTAAPGYVLVGAGDIADCASNGDDATARLLASIGGTVFTLGDNAYDRGTPAEFRHCYGPTWGRERSRTKPVPGNHDYETSGAAGYFEYFGAAAGDPARGWYAYDAGTWRVYVLNSNCADIGGCGPGSAQERWLRADLAANPRACVLAMWHHARFSSSEHGNNPITQPLWQDLSDARAELILNGHDHTYERFAPQTPDGRADPERGIVEMVVGTGGRSHYPFLTIRPNSLVRNNTTFGVLRLVLLDEGWTFEFIPVAGGSFTDSGSGTCH